MSSVDANALLVQRDGSKSVLLPKGEFRQYEQSYAYVILASGVTMRVAISDDGRKFFWRDRDGNTDKPIKLVHEDEDEDDYLDHNCLAMMCVGDMLSIDTVRKRPADPSGEIRKIIVFL